MTYSFLTSTFLLDCLSTYVNGVGLAHGISSSILQTTSIIIYKQNIMALFYLELIKLACKQMIEVWFY